MSGTFLRRIYNARRSKAISWIFICLFYLYSLSRVYGYGMITRKGLKKGQYGKKNSITHKGNKNNKEETVDKTGQLKRYHKKASK